MMPEINISIGRTLSGGTEILLQDAFRAQEPRRRPDPGGERQHNSAYLADVYEPGALGIAVERCAHTIEQLGRDTWDAIAFRGSSGAAVAYPLAAIWGYPIVHIRKDPSHFGSPGAVEGYRYAERFVIVDDFIGSGETLRTIRTQLSQRFTCCATVRAVVLYTSGMGSIPTVARLASELNCSIHFAGTRLNIKPSLQGVFGKGRFSLCRFEQAVYAYIKKVRR